MTAKRKSWLRRPLGGPTFSPKGLLLWAGIVALGFLVCHAAGLREHTTVISGTSPTGDVHSVLPIALGAVYAVVYFAFVLLVPILILAAAIFLALQLIVVPRNRQLPAHPR